MINVQVDRQKAMCAAIAAATFAAGAFSGYAIAVKRTSKKFEDILIREIASVKDSYASLARITALKKPDNPADVSRVVDNEVIEMTPPMFEDSVIDLNRYKVLSGTYTSPEEPSDEKNESDASLEKPMTVNIFEAHQDRPYPISVEEFMDDSEDYEKVSLTYYDEDSVLADDREQTINNAEYLVGEDALLMFGDSAAELFNDPNTVYVRNPKMRVDFEISFNAGSYSVLVLGLDPRIIEESGRRPKNRKARDDD